MASIQTRQELLLALLSHPPPCEANNGKCDENDKKSSKDSVSHTSLLEQFRQSQKEEGNDEEYNSNVNGRNGTGSMGPPSECTCSLEGDLAHEGQGVPDDYT